MYRYDPKDDPTDDCFRAGGDLWRVLTEDKKQILIENTVADMASVTENIKIPPCSSLLSGRSRIW